MKLFTKGFTLIEILVAISIIAILTTIVFSNFGSARDQAKNRTMFTSIKEVQLALELYKAQNGQYPEAAQQMGYDSCGDLVDSGAARQSGSDACSNGNIINPYIENLEPEYIAELPFYRDSGNSACEITYKVEEPARQWYKLTAENCFGGADSAAKAVQPDDKMARCPASCSTCDGNPMSNSYKESPAFYESFAVYSPGGECR